MFYIIIQSSYQNGRVDAMKNEKVALVITSIQSPTKAVTKFSQIDNLYSIIVADKKTPLNWEFDNIKFLSVDEQESLDYPISRYLPWNHYSRKMLGYLYAVNQGCQVIYDTDDDNIPKDNWYLPSFDGNFYVLEKDLSFVNIYQYFTEDNIWPRGFPLNLIREDYRKHFKNKVAREIKVGVWQGLADLDPDVDAVYRLVYNKECFFESKPPVVLNEGTVCPFNTQNTFF
jgi:hypothetical protein